MSLTPDLATLVSDYGLDFSIAFLLLRPRLNAELDRAKAAREAAMRLKLAAAKDEGLRGSSPSPSQENTPSPSPLASPMSPAMETDDKVIDFKLPNGADQPISIPAPKTIVRLYGLMSLLSVIYTF